MKRTLLLFFLFLLPALAGCSYLSAPRQDTAQGKPGAAQYAGGNGDCSAQAESRLRLFDRPDTYPISDEERNNARTSLYNECMKSHESQVAGIPTSDTQANAQDVSRLAALSPAAGGQPPQSGPANTAYPSGSTVIMVQGNDVSQLASLSPAAGGNPPQTGVTGAYPSGATVVVVQAPGTPPAPPAATRPAAVMPAPLARPVAASALKPPPAPALGVPPAPRALPVASTDQDTQALEQILTK